MSCVAKSNQGTEETKTTEDNDSESGSDDDDGDEQDEGANAAADSGLTATQKKQVIERAV